jgi:hypothetical protein
MNYRINTRVVIGVALLVILVTGFFIYTLVSAPTEVSFENFEEETVSEETVEQEAVLTAKHQYKDGIHTIVGMVQVPTPCHRLITEPYFIEGGTSTVEVRFSTFLEGESCPSELFETPFSVSFEASEDATITATWNGVPIRLNRVPVGPDEVLDANVYMKG